MIINSRLMTKHSMPGRAKNGVRLASILSVNFESAMCRVINGKHHK